MKVALGVEYDGSAFNGFQLQRDVPSVQGALESALSRVAASPVRIEPAGRTDTGVHATGQVVAFATDVARPLRAWVRGGNALLPPGVRITWAQSVSDDFSARFSAVARRYLYVFFDPMPSPAVGHLPAAVGDGPAEVTDGQQPVKAPPLLAAQVVPASGLDDRVMHQAAQALLGEQDFSAVRGAGCQSRTAFRCVHRVSVRRHGCFVVLDITANAFLLHMVRNIAGVLWQVGRGQRPMSWVRELLASQDRRQAGPTAPPQGLYLVHVHYPDWDFPLPAPPPMLRVLGGLDRF